MGKNGFGESKAKTGLEAGTTLASALEVLDCLIFVLK
jgi:hypothetical protein